MKGKVGGEWNKIFMEIFRSMLHGLLPFSPVFLYGLKDLFTLHKLADKVALAIKTDDVTSSRWEMELHGSARMS